MPSVASDEVTLATAGTTLSGTTLGSVLASLPPLGPEGPWIAGGALRRTILREPRHADFDFFFRDQAQLEGFEEALVARGLTRVRHTPHLAHYRGTVDGMGPEIDVQCISFMFYGSAEQLVDSFDFTLCQLAFDGTDLTFGDRTLADVSNRVVAIHRITYAVSSLMRLAKYASQMFMVPDEVVRTLREIASDDPKAMFYDVEDVASFEPSPSPDLVDA